MEQTAIHTIEIRPDEILVVSKTNAKSFHAGVKDRVKETGYGLAEAAEMYSFIEKVKEEAAADPEWRDMIRAEVAKYGKDAWVTPRGVKFEAAEVGTKYDFSKCNDPELLELEEIARKANDALKERKEFLKTIPAAGIVVVADETGAVDRIYPPSKSSTSSYKISLPK